MYCAFFGLQEKPFNITPDPRFLFLSQSHQEALGQLLYGIEERKGFIVITGEVGAGKTLLCRALLDRLGRQVRTALIFNSFMSELDLLQSINEDFGIPPSGATRKELIDQLNLYLINECAAGRTAVLIIDEGQNLAPPVLEQIRMLSNLETERGKLLQIVLVGQPELRQQLARPDLRQLNQRIALRQHLQPFTRQETEAYINHRLLIAGSQGGVKVSRRALSVIFRLSRGIPRNINLLCDRAMLSAYIHGSSRIEAKHIRQAWVELEGQDGGGGFHLAGDTPRRRFLVAPGLVLGIALTLGGGAWLGFYRTNPLELPTVAPDAISETSGDVSDIASGDASALSRPTPLASLPAAAPANALSPIQPATSEATGEGAVEVTLDSAGDRPSWLHFDGSSVHISGLAPLTAEDGPYHLILRAKAGEGREGALHLYVTRIAPADPSLPSSPTGPGPAPASQPPEPRCLVAILKGEPCP